MKNVIKTINIVVITILLIILIFSSVFIVKSCINKDEVPDVMGYIPLVVLSGSMESEIMSGDLVLVNKVDTSELAKDDIIAFYSDNGKKTIITHRIVDIKDNNGKLEFITKGDSNEARDSQMVPQNLVVGKYNGKRYGGIGNIVIFLQTPTGMCIAISIPLGILIICQFLQSKKDKEEIENLKNQAETQN